MRSTMRRRSSGFGTVEIGTKTEQSERRVPFPDTMDRPSRNSGDMRTPPEPSK